MQGLTHFNEIQALFVGHSALTTHSGLQFGGEPRYSGKHVQTACSFTTLHALLGPHGVGAQGLVVGSLPKIKLTIKVLFQFYFPI